MEGIVSHSSNIHLPPTDTAKDWEKYDELRNSINEPLDKLESELKRYRKYYDPVMGAKKLAQKKCVLEENKKSADEMFEAIQSSYKTIMVLAGEDKKDFLDREVRSLNLPPQAPESWHPVLHSVLCQVYVSFGLFFLITVLPHVSYFNSIDKGGRVAEIDNTCNHRRHEL